MASCFWYLEDGRGFANRWSGMFHLLKIINEEIRQLKGALAFAEYLDSYIWNEETDEYDGHGGFIRKSTGENIFPEFDLREFIPENRTFFWEGAQLALNRLILANDEASEGLIYLLKKLLDMHKRIKRGEVPQLLNDLIGTTPGTGKKMGPGWVSNDNEKTRRT